MPSVMGLLEERELAARQRVESLREEMDQLMAVLCDAEATWQRMVITRETVSEVLSGPGELDAVEASAGDARPAMPGPRPGKAERDIWQAISLLESVTDLLLRARLQAALILQLSGATLPAPDASGMRAGVVS
ncbi:hypothetical protein NLX86_31695 [Streptomyces sp. A3M-1-3]|uniref:hypothetical protein n=1 Tax=Streptomyces sp. A3M-1-3 TaxID=2962044 RepID=UPI0020B82346|nr:hypothetical protein [Streptomyces sp. A3M-1-3]MCP3822487.1 hypothetical protein [Streptomyces sp. A3M-1-3]